MAGSMASFVISDTLMKLALIDLPLFQAILIRGVFGCILMAALCWYFGAFKTHGGVIAALSNRPVVLRTIGETGGTFFFLTALSHMQIANVTAVLQVLPLTITLGAALFLGETVGWKRYVAILIGFIGVMLIIKPGSEGFSLFSIYALIATLFITLRDLSTRRLPKTTPSLLVSMVTAIMVTALGAIGTLFESWHQVSGDNLVILLAAATILMAGYVFSILAMRVGDVGFVAPFRYSILIWALLLG